MEEYEWIYVTPTFATSTLTDVWFAFLLVAYTYPPCRIAAAFVSQIITDNVKLDRFAQLNLHVSQFLQKNFDRKRME